MDRIDDAYNGLMGEEFMRKTRERLHWICSKVTGENVLDVGCSQGTLARLLAALGKSVLGLDINKDAISYADARLSEVEASSRERIRFVAANFMDYKATDRFDTVVMGEILEHLPAPEAFVKKAWTHLSPGGRFVVTVPFGINDDPDHRQTFYSSWVREIVAPFFDIADVRYFGKWIGVVGTRRDRKTAVEKSIPLSAVKELEKAFYAIERPLVNDVKARGLRLQTQQKDIEETRKSLASKTAEAKTAAAAGNEQRARADKAAADYAKLKTDLTAEIAKQKETATKALADKNAADAAAAKQKTVLEGEIARQKTALVAEQAKTKDLNAKLVATRNELASVKNEALESRVSLEAERKISGGQTEQITILKAALQLAANRPQVDASETRLLEYSQEVRDLRAALDLKRDEAVSRAEQYGRLSGELNALKVERDALTRKVSEMSSEIASQAATIDESRNHARVCEEANAKLEAQSKEYAERLKKVSAEKAELEACLSTLEDENAVVKSDIEKADARQSELSFQLDAALKALDRMRMERDEGTMKCTALRSECDGLKNTNATLGENFNLVQTQLNAVRSALANAELVVKKLQDEKHALEAADHKALKTQQTTITAQKAEAAKFNAELAKAKAMIAAEQKKSTDFVAQLKRANAALKVADGQLSTLRKENTVISKQKSQAERRLTVEKLKYDKLAKAKLGRLTLAYWRLKDSLKRLFFKQQQIHRSTSSVVTNVNPYLPAIERMRKRLAALSASTALGYRRVSDFLRITKVACIMDEFTWKSYSPEANMIQLAPESYKDQLNDFRPEIIFVESAWRGVDNKWTNCIHKIPDELKGILTWAKGHGVPTVFWNKEDPIHFDTFKNAASLFDFIFTYDFNCVQKYKQITGRDNAFFLPMAVQPTMFNPIEKYERKDAFCFAGSYYKRYVERAKDLDGYIKAFPAYKSVEIYDRQFGKNDPNYMMPPEYAPHIKGNLPYDEIDKAYKGYLVAINLNSIKQANSIARRVFELLACNTATVSNYSYGVLTGFGDLVITSDDADVVLEALKKYQENLWDFDKFRLLGVRKVFSENTYRDRFAYICSKILGVDLASCKPVVAVVTAVKDEAEYQRVRRSFERQTYEDKRLFVLTKGNVDAKTIINGVDDLLRHLDGIDYVGMMSPADSYFDSYIEDLVHAFKYSSMNAVGKGSYFRRKRNKVILQSGYKPYSMMRNVNLHRGLMMVEAFSHVVSRKPNLLRSHAPVVKIEALSIDMFNYCEHGALDGLTDIQIDEISDLRGIDTGFRFSEMQKMAETLKPIHQKQPEGLSISSAKLYDCCKNVKCNKVEQTFENGHMSLLSELGKGEFVYFPISKEFRVEDIPLKDGTLWLNQETGYPSSVLASIAYFFYDAKKNKIKSFLAATNVNLTVDIPQGTKFVKFALRLQASDTLEVGALNFSHKPTPLPYYFDRNEFLCLLKNYPAYDNLYKNGFVHARLKLYERQGVNVTVFKLTQRLEPVFSEFEGIRVISGNEDYLKFILAHNKYRAVLVHFLDEDLWRPLSGLPFNVQIVAWSHGSDVLKYNRRLFNYANEQQLDKARTQSAKTDVFWRGLLHDIPVNLHFVFVSNWIKSVVEQDYDVRIPADKYSIINNPINMDLFKFEEKSPELRYKVLSIRPFASKKYANDLSVKCILELSKRNDFGKFEFTIIGDGPLFDEVLEPLRGFANVHILRKFMRQNEIYVCHRQNGIFLVPSREDTHGVSRDEAMSSGLVPVTNAVTAIPEFVDDTCCVLAPAEDYRYMAEGIGRIVDNPQLFLEMSRAASERVKRQTSSDVIIKKELSLIAGGIGSC